MRKVDKNIASEVDPKLDQNIMIFVRLLRATGVRLGAASTLEAIDAVESVGIRRKDFFYHALVSCLVRCKKDRPIFDQAFAIFWQNPKFHEKIRDILLPKVKMPSYDAVEADTMLRRLSDVFSENQKDQLKNNQDVEITFDNEGTFSSAEKLKNKDFEMMSVSEMDAARLAISRLKPDLPYRLVKNSRLSSKGRFLDLRATLRASGRRFGVLSPVFISKIQKPRPVVVLCDISGSMEHYSRVMLHFMHVLSARHQQVFSFLFGTRLTNISHLMKHRDVDQSINAISEAVKDWSGGTKISDCLHKFNQDWSRRVLGQGAVTLLVTDGLDRDNDFNLGFEMERLQKSTSVLVWLNPLLRFDQFVPKSKSIQTMIKNVDYFLPIHSLKAMNDLAQSLSKIHRKQDNNLSKWQTLARQAAFVEAVKPLYTQEKG